MVGIPCSIAGLMCVVTHCSSLVSDYPRSSIEDTLSLTISIDFFFIIVWESISHIRKHWPIAGVIVTHPCCRSWRANIIPVQLHLEEWFINDNWSIEIRIDSSLVKCSCWRSHLRNADTCVTSTLNWLECIVVRREYQRLRASSGNLKKKEQSKNPKRINTLTFEDSKSLKKKGYFNVSWVIFFFYDHNPENSSGGVSCRKFNAASKDLHSRWSFFLATRVRITKPRLHIEHNR